MSKLLSRMYFIGNLYDNSKFIRIHNRLGIRLFTCCVIMRRRTGRFWARQLYVIPQCCFTALKLRVYSISHRKLCTMASKRRHGEKGRTEKKKTKSCEEAAELCSVVEDEQVKKAVKEAWGQKTHYSQGQWRKPRFYHLTNIQKLRVDLLKGFRLWARYF